MLNLQPPFPRRQAKNEDDSSPKSFQKERLGFPESFPQLGFHPAVGYSRAAFHKPTFDVHQPAFIPNGFVLARQFRYSQDGIVPTLYRPPVDLDEPEIAIPVARVPESRFQQHKSVMPTMHMQAISPNLMQPVARAMPKTPESFCGLSQDSVDPLVEETITRLLNKQPLNKNSVERLSSAERWLVRALVKKIFNIVLSDPVESLDFVDVVNQSRDKGRSKRLEEELKVVFKKTMKFLLTRYKEGFDAQDIPETPKKFDYVVGFYKKYFEDVYKSDQKFREFFKIVAADKSLDVKKLNSELIHPLTVNAQHISLVMRSMLFKKEAIEYIDKQLVRDYEKIRELKIKKILKKFYDVVSRDRSKENIDLFIGNSQTKLPWSTKDLEMAIKDFMDIVKRSEHNSETSSV